MFRETIGEFKQEHINETGISLTTQNSLRTESYTHKKRKESPNPNKSKNVKSKKTKQTEKKEKELKPAKSQEVIKKTISENEEL